MRRHHPIVRITHWVNAVALTIMVASGLRIFNAHPGFARVNETFCCYPLAGRPVPEWLTLGGWLAGARHWHFAFMWLLVLNGAVYLGFIWTHGEWRDLVPRRGDARDAWEMVKFYLFARRDHPRQGKHNALQKLVYFVLPLVALVAVLSGLAIWKPVQLAPLTAVFGGFVWARYIHFLAMVVIVVLALGHVFMVLTVDPYSFASMVTGGYDPALSPERRNARPFYHLLPSRAGRSAGSADGGDGGAGAGAAGSIAPARSAAERASRAPSSRSEPPGMPAVSTKPVAAPGVPPGAPASSAGAPASSAATGAAGAGGAGDATDAPDEGSRERPEDGGERPRGEG